MADNPRPVSTVASTPAPDPLSISSVPGVGASLIPVTASTGPRAVWTTRHFLTLLIILGLITGIGITVQGSARLIGWLLVLVLTAGSLGIVGHGMTGSWKGALIDDRNRISLSRFQLILWTLLVTSGLVTGMLSNAAHPPVDGSSPLSISFPPELLLLMGISTTSLVGSPLILGFKSAPTANEGANRIQAQDSMAAVNIDPTTVDVKGSVVVRTSPSDAQWSDLFKGEEVKNATYFDVARVQMLYFTLILVLGYSAALGYAFLSQKTGFSGFPAIDQNVVLMLGISHTGYLTSKAIPR
jgi:hypothetical protein